MTVLRRPCEVTAFQRAISPTIVRVALREVKQQPDNMIEVFSRLSETPLARMKCDCLLPGTCEGFKDFGDCSVGGGSRQEANRRVLQSRRNGLQRESAIPAGHGRETSPAMPSLIGALQAQGQHVPTRPRGRWRQAGPAADFRPGPVRSLSFRRILHVVRCPLSGAVGKSILWTPRAVPVPWRLDRTPGP